MKIKEILESIGYVLKKAVKSPVAWIVLAIIASVLIRILLPGPLGEWINYVNQRIRR